ncbi:hypothetical protein C8J57DRAFT_404803 [Mycena rebaudengoi]|nr:hypothetical protein C8J57DRAFT_404803 [Mycena rebaudengoi]
MPLHPPRRPPPPPRPPRQPSPPQPSPSSPPSPPAPSPPKRPATSPTRASSRSRVTLRSSTRTCSSWTRARRMQGRGSQGLCGRAGGESSWSMCRCRRWTYLRLMLLPRDMGLRDMGTRGGRGRERYDGRERHEGRYWERHASSSSSAAATPFLWRRLIHDGPAAERGARCGGWRRRDRREQHDRRTRKTRDVWAPAVAATAGAEWGWPHPPTRRVARRRRSRLIFLCPECACGPGRPCKPKHHRGSRLLSAQQARKDGGRLGVPPPTTPALRLVRALPQQPANTKQRRAAGEHRRLLLLRVATSQVRRDSSRHEGARHHESGRHEGRHDGDVRGGRHDGGGGGRHDGGGGDGARGAPSRGGTLDDRRSPSTASDDLEEMLLASTNGSPRMHGAGAGRSPEWGRGAAGAGAAAGAGNGGREAGYVGKGGKGKGEYLSVLPCDSTLTTLCRTARICAAKPSTGVPGVPLERERGADGGGECRCCCW